MAHDDKAEGDMARDTLLSRHRCSIFALLGVLACGDGSARVLVPSEAPAPEAAASPATVNGGDAVAAPVEPPPASAATDRGGASEEGSPAPIMREPASPPASGSSSQAAAGDAPASDAPASDAPASDEPASDEPAEPSPSTQPAGDAPGDKDAPANEPANEPTSEAPADDEVDEAPIDETPSDEPTSTAPTDGSSLARGDDPTRQSSIDPGPFDVNIVTTGLRDGPDYGSQTLYLPDGAEPPLAAVVIVPGRDELESSIAAWGPFLASHGIVTLTFGTNDPGDGADARAAAVLDALETIRAENARAGGPLQGQLAVDHLGVMGWSAGGAGVLRVASSTPALKAAIALAPFSPGEQFPDDQVPTLLLAGSADPRAGGQSQGVFESLPDATPKMLFEVQDGLHEVGNEPQNGGGEVGLYGLSWLEVFLVGDERYRQFLAETPTQASDFRASLGNAP